MRPLALHTTLLIVIGLGGIVGCSSYKPIEHPQTSSTLHLAPILNNTKATNVVVNLQRELRSRLLDQGYNLSASPDPTLEVILTYFNRETISLDSIDTGKPLSYRLILTAKIIWKSTDQQSPWGSESMLITVEKPIYVAPSMIDAEYQVTPAMVEDLADQIANAILYPW